MSFFEDETVEDEYEGSWLTEEDDDDESSMGSSSEDFIRFFQFLNGSSNIIF